MKKPFRNKVTTRSKTVLINEFKNIVGVANIRRLVLFDAVNGEATLTDKSVNKQNATLSLPAGSLDQAIAGKLKALNFNGTGDYWDFEDTNDLSFGDGSADSAYSLVACVNPNAISGELIMKYGEETGSTKKEFAFGFTSSKLFIRNYDDNLNKSIGRMYNTALTGDIGTYHTYITTYDATSASSGFKLYRDNINVDDADYASAVGYVAMENKGAKVGNYYLSTTGAKTGISSCKYTFVAIVSIELTQGQITAIDTLLRRYVGVI